MCAADAIGPSEQRTLVASIQSIQCSVHHWLTVACRKIFHIAEFLSGLALIFIAVSAQTDICAKCQIGVIEIYHVKCANITQKDFFVSRAPSLTAFHLKHLELFASQHKRGGFAHPAEHNTTQRNDDFYLFHPLKLTTTRFVWHNLSLDTDIWHVQRLPFLSQSLLLLRHVAVRRVVRNGIFTALLLIFVSTVQYSRIRYWIILNTWNETKWFIAHKSINSVRKYVWSVAWTVWMWCIIFLIFIQFRITCWVGCDLCKSKLPFCQHDELDSVMIFFRSMSRYFKLTHAPSTLLHCMKRPNRRKSKKPFQESKFKVKRRLVVNIRHDGHVSFVVRLSQ